MIAYGQTVGDNFDYWGARVMHEVLSQELFTQAKEIKPGDHLVALYSVEREIADYVSAYINQPGPRGQMLYIAGDLDTSEVLGVQARR